MQCNCLKYNYLIFRTPLVLVYKTGAKLYVNFDSYMFFCFIPGIKMLHASF